MIKGKNIYMSNLFGLARIRIIEEEIAKEYYKQEMRCPIHLSIGQEAVPVGVSKSLNFSDYIVSTHRCHAHYIAKGGSIQKLVSELYGKEDGACKGIGGSMHLYDKSINHLSSIPIVAGSIPIGVGIGYALKLKNKKNVSVVYFGDAATEEGVFFESLHFAALKKLPVIFVCEDNKYSVYTSINARQGNRNLKKIIESLNIKFIKPLNNNVHDIEKKALQARSYAISKGPVFIYSNTYRYLEHCGPNNDDDLKYRPKEEINYWLKKDPISIEIQRLKKIKRFNSNEYLEFCNSVKQEIITSFVNAKKSKPFSLLKLSKLEYAK
jgi:pyruvate dehydrogenase E1 component alpha subunit